MTRPYIIINCAMSLDGKLALPTRKQTKISSEGDIARVHRLRASVDGILVGIGTILSDDPSLTVKSRYVPDAKNPVRIVLDSYGRIPEKSKVLNDDAPTIIAVSKKCRKKRIRNAEMLKTGSARVDIAALLGELKKRGIDRLLVEGGGRVIWSFLKDGLFDELNVYVGSVAIGGGPTLADGSGIKSLEDAVRLKLESAERLDDGLLLKYLPAG
jgi:2,5-diamino-6-(ribosylamino)-4(3H)-pyrimidinone 5'-phosphate reductase